MTRSRVFPALLAGVSLVANLAAAPAAAQDWGDTPYVQTPQNIVDRMLEIAKIGPADYVIDLGSGDGRMVITAAMKYGARGFGVDLDRKLVELANRNAAKAGVGKRAVFYARDLHDTDVSAATVMSIYLLPEVNLMIRSRLLSTLRPGTRIVSHDYAMGEWAPDHQEELDAPGKTVGVGQRSKIYYWMVPGRAAGRWRGRLAAEGKPIEFEVAVQQKFQMLQGTMAAGGRNGRMEKGRLAGEHIEFEAPVQGVPYRFSGKITTHAIEGKARPAAAGAAREVSWSATRVELWDTRHDGMTVEQAVKEIH